MKPTHYLAAFVRVFSVLLFLYGLRQSLFVIGLVTGELNGLSVPLVFALSSVVLPVLVAWFLWNFPMMVATSILKPEIDQAVEPMNAQATLTVLLLAIALVFLYLAIIDAVHWATIWQMAERSHRGQAPLYLNEEHKANMLATTVELFVSAALILKARTLARKMLRVSA
jgi:hypothetical protein